MSSKVTKFMGNGNVKKGKKTKRKVGDKNVDPTVISKQNLSPSKKFKVNPDEPKGLFCDICKVEFNEISKKEKHMAVLHKSQMTKVEKKSVPTKAKEPNNKPKEFHPCSSCQERFDSKNKLKKHLRIAHPKCPAKSKQGRNGNNGGFIPSKAPRPPPGPPGPPVAQTVPRPEDEDEEEDEIE